jgi:hypothetical protein
LSGEADQTTGHEGDAEDDRAAQHERPVLGEAAEHRVPLKEQLQQCEGERAQHGAGQPAHAAQDQHQQHRAGLMP